ncbi:hypothetical protein VTO73DRAFT_2394 [Trametes versicolor]
MIVVMTSMNGLLEPSLVSGNVIKELIIPREGFLILTKVDCQVDPGCGTNTGFNTAAAESVINQKGLNREHIFDSMEASSKRLQPEYVDMQPRHDVVKAGYVRYIGMSSCYAYQSTSLSSPSSPNTLSHPFFVPVIQMQNYAITHNQTPFISMQNHYSLMYREEEREMFPTQKMYGVASIPWSPLARRPNTASSKRGDIYPILARYKTQANLVEELAKTKGVEMAQVALAWIFAKPGGSAPIIGTTNLSNLEELLGALDIKLSKEEVKYLEEPYKPMIVVGAL